MKTQNTSTKQPSRTRRRLIIWGAILGLLILGSTALTIFFANFYSTKDIEATASQFKPPADWQIIDKEVRSRKLLCLDGGSCPQLSTRWTTSTPISMNTLIPLLDQTGWTYQLSGVICGPDYNKIPDRISYCVIDGDSGQYFVRLTIKTDDVILEKTHITLSIWPKA